MRKRPPRREARGGADVYHFFRCLWNRHSGLQGYHGRHHPVKIKQAGSPWASRLLLFLYDCFICSTYACTYCMKFRVMGDAVFTWGTPMPSIRNWGGWMGSATASLG